VTRRGPTLILTTPQGNETNYAMNRLDSATWLDLAKQDMNDWPERDFVTGLFLSFDRYPDAQSARKRFNAAADAGRDVTIWVQRLEEVERQRKQPAAKTGASDPSSASSLLGKWTLSGKNVNLAVEFKSRGVATIFVRQRSISAKWVEESPGVYRLTDQFQKTLIVNLSGNRMSVRGPNQRFRGVRQAE
jgi:hypothetical protein